MSNDKKPADEDQSASTGAKDAQRTSPTAQPADRVVNPNTERPEQSNVAADPDVDTSEDPEHKPPQNDPSAKTAPQV